MYSLYSAENLLLICIERIVKNLSFITLVPVINFDGAVLKNTVLRYWPITTTRTNSYRPKRQIASSRVKITINIIMLVQYCIEQYLMTWQPFDYLIILFFNFGIVPCIVRVL